MKKHILVWLLGSFRLSSLWANDFNTFSVGQLSIFLPNDILPRGLYFLRIVGEGGTDSPSLVRWLH